MIEELSSEKMTEALATAKIRLGYINRIEVLKNTPSSNTELLEAEKKGMPSGTFYVANRQEAGRGRFSRSWYMAEGDVACSLLLKRPYLPKPLTLLALMPAVAIIEALDECGIQAMIKWPNDIVVKDAESSHAYFADYLKIGGILVENVMRQGTTEASVIGIGLNLTASAAHKELVPHRGHLGLWKSIPRSVLLAQLLTALDRHIGQFSDARYAAYLHGNFVERCASVGKNIFIDKDGQKIVGVGEAILEDGALVLKENDTSHLIYSGEVNFCT